MNGVADNLNGILLVLVPALPLLAALLGYAFQLSRGRASAAVNAWLGGIAMLLSGGLALALILRIQQAQALLNALAQSSAPDNARLAQLSELSQAVFTRHWFTLPAPPDGLAVPLAFNGAEPQLLFAVATALIGFAVLVFAARERRGDERAGVFFATLTLFTGSMLLFLTADTLILLYIAWELMGLCSYLLIAHPATAEARRAARQAFWTTRATDFGLLFAVILLLTVFQRPTLSSIDIGGLLNAVVQQGGNPQAVYPWLSAVALLALFAVVGKAAQLPLCFWLPDAMVAPAPVSALLHAATMVAAGPYLLVRLHGFFSTQDLPLLLATLLGGLTLLLGAAMALAATDPKRILAYSTVSHLGLVVLSVGVLAEEAGFYHLLAHAWFKAALFLGVGYLVAVWVAEGRSGQPAAAAAGGHSAPKLGELAGAGRRHPWVLWGVLLPAGLSLAGLFPLAGALGKEQVLYALLTRYAAMPAEGQATIGARFPLAAAGWWAASGMLILAIPLTAAYITRLVGVLGWGHAQPPAVHLDQRGAIPTGDRPAATVNRGWGPGLALAVVLALIGSVGWAVVYFSWFATPSGFITAGSLWKWSAASLGGRAAQGVSLLGVIVGAGLTWYLRVARPESGTRLFREGGMAPLAAWLRNGLYLRELFQLVVGRLGELLAVLAGRADVGLVDWLALRCGWLGRLLAALARWVDDHVVDGLRWLACELWWALKRLHARFMQTGYIQHYMLIVLIGAALLCLVVLRPLSHILAEILGRM